MKLNSYTPTKVNSTSRRMIVYDTQIKVIILDDSRLTQGLSACYLCSFWLGSCGSRNSIGLPHIVVLVPNTINNRMRCRPFFASIAYCMIGWPYSA